jgi:hypothetical protein
VKADADVHPANAMPARRFPPPWSAEITPNCSIVRDVKAPTSIMKANQVGDRQQSYSAKMSRTCRKKRFWESPTAHTRNHLAA